MRTRRPAVATIAVTRMPVTRSPPSMAKFGRGGEVEREEEKDVELALVDGGDLEVVEAVEAEIRIAARRWRLGEDGAAAAEVVAVVLGGGGGRIHEAR